MRKILKNILKKLSQLFIFTILIAGVQTREKRSIDLNAVQQLISDPRLDKEVVPTGYKLELQPFPELETFQGRVRINVTWLEKSKSINLHAHSDLQIIQSDIKVTPLGDVHPIKVMRTDRSAKKSLFTIYLEQEIKATTQCELDITFSGRIETNTYDGIFASQYSVKGSTDKEWAVATHMRPNNARRVFPCFDEPAFKAPIELSVARLANYTVLSNMPVVRVEPATSETGWYWDHFERTPPISTFTFGFVVSRLKKLETTLTSVGSANLTIYGREDYLEALVDVPERVTKIVKTLEAYWGVPYPLTKLDIVALPNYQGVRPVDNWGLILFKESELSRSGYWHIAQEVTYQWLGSYATPYWWNDAHINKALASYLAAYTAFQLDDGRELQGKWPMTILYSIYYEFSKRYPHSRITGMKYETTSSKTELLFRMLNYTLGESTFKSGLQKFLLDKKLKTFFGDDIWSALTEQAHVDQTLSRNVSVNEIAISWITKDRLPVVMVTRDYNSGSATLKQRLYLRDRPHDVPDQDKMLWWIPIVLAREDNLNFQNSTPFVWMKKEREITIRGLPSGDKFIIINPEEIGPFPVNYDPQNWNMLAQYLLKSHGRNTIPVYTRAKLLHDAWNLAYAGDLSFATALNMTLFLKYERDHLAWDPVFTMVDHIGRHIDSSEVHKKFETYVRLLLTPLFEDLGADVKTDEDPGVTHLRGLAKIFLCRAGYKPCIEEAQAAFKNWMDAENPDEGNPVANQYICPVFKWGTKEEWEFGLERIINFPVGRKQSERTYLLKTLAGCPIETWKIEKILNMTIVEQNGNFTDTDIYLIFSMLSGSSNGYTTLFNFLKQHWDLIRVRFEEKPHLWDSLITSATTVFTTQDGLDRVSELYVEKQGEFGSAEYIIEKAIKNIKEETKWSDENLPVIEAWLNYYLAEASKDE